MAKKKSTDSIEPAEVEQSTESIPPADSAGTQPPDPPQFPAPAPKPAPLKPSGPNFWQRLGRAFLFLMRVTILLLVIFAVVVFVYIGIPAFYDNVVLPTQNNTNRIFVLESQQQTLNSQLADSQNRAATLEAQLASHADTIDNLDTRITNIESEITARTESITALEGMLATLQTSQTDSNAELDRQIKLLKSMELISRARLFLYQSNFGLAEQDVASARLLLAAIQPEAPAPLNTDLIEVLDRIDSVINYLPEFPVAAISDLDIAWQILMHGIPQPEATLTP